jgi:prophage regulatory protein
MKTQNSSEGLVLRIKGVCEMVALSKSTVLRLMKAGDFPQSFPLSGYAVGWCRAEVEAWIDARKNTRQC